MAAKYPRFSMNRTCAPQLGLADFITLAKGAGIGAVEIRNDVSGREFMDGTPAEAILEPLQHAGLRVAAVNALQRFNDWTREREREAEFLMTFAAKLQAPGVVLCPVHNPDHGWSVSEAERNLRDGLKHLRPILSDAGVKGYVEPLGMAGSTMKKQKMAVEAIEDIGGWDTYQLCFDTFQFFRCGDDKIFFEAVGLAHMSGITREDLPPDALTEPDRGLVGAIDRVGNIALLRDLLASGYKGYISMEPFDPRVQNAPALQADLVVSFDHTARSLDGAGGSHGH